MPRTTSDLVSVRRLLLGRGEGTIFRTPATTTTDHFGGRLLVARAQDLQISLNTRLNSNYNVEVRFRFEVSSAFLTLFVYGCVPSGWGHLNTHPPTVRPSTRSLTFTHADSLTHFSLSHTRFILHFLPSVYECVRARVRRARVCLLSVCAFIPCFVFSFFLFR